MPLDPNLAWITPRITVANIIAKTVLPTDVVRAQFLHWYCIPVNALLESRDVRDCGYAITMMTLAQFEPLGRYLTGVDYEGRGVSGMLFKEAMTKYLQYLENLGEFSIPEITRMRELTGNGETYRYSRCAMLHSAIMPIAFFVNMGGAFSQPFNIVDDSIIISPELFYRTFKGFVEAFLSSVEESDPDTELVERFNKGYKYVFDVSEWTKPN